MYAMCKQEDSIVDMGDTINASANNNNNSNNNSSSVNITAFVPQDKEILTSVLLACIALGSFLGNTLVILSVATNKRLRTVTNCFVVSLAIADCLMSILVLPLNIKVTLTGTWKLGAILCDLWISMDVMLCTASILNLCCISLDRYFAITKPLMYATKRSKRLALIMIASVWVLSAVITSPAFLGWQEEGRHQDGAQCLLIRNPGYIIYSATGSFFIPLLVMIFVYARIFKVAREREKRLKPYRRSFVNRGASYRHVSTTLNGDLGRDRLSVLDDETNIDDSTSSGDKGVIVLTNYTYRDSMNNSEESSPSRNSTSTKKSSYFNHTQTRSSNNNGSIAMADTNRSSMKSMEFPSRRRADLKKERAVLKTESKSAKTLAVVVGCFIVCWLPFFVMYLVEGLCTSCQIDPLLGLVLTWLGYVNSGLNPFIYAFYNKQFRKSFWDLTFGLFSRRRRTR